ncbi:MAG: phosphoserine phosphatase SerB [Pseudomonadota bacterium]
MEFVVTLVAPAGQALEPERVAPLVAAVKAHHVERLDRRAADVMVNADDGARLRADVTHHLGSAPVDAIVQPLKGRAKRLLMSDMDSTLIGQECIDELAGALGLKPQVAAITERAMRGEIDFATALRERVGLLKGTPESAIADCLKNVVTLNEGAATLISACKRHGVRTVLVSGGFVQFAEPIAATLGMDAAFANTLNAEGGVLTGTVAEPILGADAKRDRLLHECEALGIDVADAVAVGDGANDLAMVERAGLGVAYKAKPLLRDGANAAVDHTDLTTVAYAMGLTPEDETIDEVLDKADANRQNEKE